METEVALNSERVSQLFTFFETQKTLLTTYTDQWAKLSSHFTTLEQSLTSKSNSIDSKLESLETQTQKTLETLTQLEDSLPERETQLIARIEEQKVQALAEFEKDGVAEKIELGESLKSLCRKMDSLGLLRIMTVKRKDAVLLRKEIKLAIVEAVDPYRLVLDVVKDYLDRKDVKGGVSDRRWACGTLLSALFPAEEKTVAVAGSVKERAVGVAEVWKAKMESEEGGSVEAAMLLQMAVGFGLVDRFEKEFLRKLVVENSSKRDMPKLANALGFGEKMGGVEGSAVSGNMGISQVSQAIVDILPTIPSDTTNAIESFSNTKKRNPHFSMHEDEEICNSWCAIVDVDQTGKNLWKRIYDEYKTRIPDTPRSHESVHCRWKSIQKSVSIYQRILEALVSSQGSDYNHDGLVKMAKITYHAEEKQNFVFDHCYSILKDHSKWNTTFQARKKKIGRGAVDVEVNFLKTETERTAIDAEVNFPSSETERTAIDAEVNFPRNDTVRTFCSMSSQSSQAIEGISPTKLTTTPNAGGSTLKTKGRSQHFSEHEDEEICKSWCAIMDMEQAGKNLWKRIYEEYKIRMPDTTRSHESVHCRWKSIQKSVSVYQSILEDDLSSQMSDYNYDGSVGRTKMAYHAKEKHDFVFDHCYAILKDNSKWNTLLVRKFTRKRSQRETVDVEGDSPTIESERIIERLDSEKKAKTRIKKVGAGESYEASNVLLDRIETINQNQVESRDDEMRRFELEVRLKEVDATNAATKAKYDKIALTRQEYEARVIATDTSMFDPEVRELYEAKKSEITAKWRNERLQRELEEQCAHNETNIQNYGSST